jgi:uncharacterized protein
VIAYVDTSAFWAILDRQDQHHAEAQERWAHLLENAATLVCTNYVLLETTTLLQSRTGMAVVRDFTQDLAPLLTVEWVTSEIHQAGVGALLGAARRHLSLTDCVSFEVMRRLGIRHAFAFDRHFREQGFEDVE